MVSHLIFPSSINPFLLHFFLYFFFLIRISENSLDNIADGGKQMFLRERQKERGKQMDLVAIKLKINSCVVIRAYASPLCHDSHSIRKTHRSTLAGRDTRSQKRGPKSCSRKIISSAHNDVLN